MILADENLHGFIIAALRGVGMSVTSVRESASGISDEEVIDLAVKNDWILVTQDKDFGEWVFSHHKEGLTVLFLRFTFGEHRDVANSVIQFLNNPPSERPYFATITTKKVRVRRL